MTLFASRAERAPDFPRLSIRITIGDMASWIDAVINLPII